jgi:hypothetical protein
LKSAAIVSIPERIDPRQIPASVAERRCIPGFSLKQTETPRQTHAHLVEDVSTPQQTPICHEFWHW